MDVEICSAIYGLLPQAWALANKILKEHLEPFGYFEVRNTLGLFKYVWRTIAFSLVEVCGEGARGPWQRLRKSTKYPISEDWEEKLYCGISLEWDYKNRMLDYNYSMPGYT